MFPEYSLGNPIFATPFEPPSCKNLKWSYLGFQMRSELNKHIKQCGTITLSGVEQVPIYITIFKIIAKTPICNTHYTRGYKG